VVHSDRDTEHGCKCDQVSTDVSVRDRAVVSSPVVHHIVSRLERAFFAIASRSKPCTRPGIVCTFPQCVRYIFRKSYCPSLCYLEHRSKALYKVQTDHCSRHLYLCLETAGVSAAAEVSEVSHVPCCSVHDRLLVFLCYIPPFFHNAVAVLIFCSTACVKTACTGVDQVDDTAILF